MLKWEKEFKSLWVMDRQPCGRHPWGSAAVFSSGGALGHEATLEHKLHREIAAVENNWVKATVSLSEVQQRRCFAGV
eukprot:406019-Pelagomonas_calceolata.AAC.4